MPSDNWRATLLGANYGPKTRAAKAIVDGYARISTLITYDQLLIMLNWKNPLEPAVLLNMLDFISSDADEHGRGLITVVVVKSLERPVMAWPSDGWFTLAESLGRDVSDRHNAVVRERVHVFAHANDEVESSIL
jgi:hypothetical protein